MNKYKKIMLNIIYNFSGSKYYIDNNQVKKVHMIPTLINIDTEEIEDKEVI